MIELSLILLLNLGGLLVSIPLGRLAGGLRTTDTGLARLGGAVRGATRTLSVKLLRHGGLLTIGTAAVLSILGYAFAGQTAAWVLLAPLIGGAATLCVAYATLQFTHHAVERMAALSSAPPESVASAIALRAGGASIGISEAISSLIVVGALLVHGNHPGADSGDLVTALAAVSVGASIASMLVHSVTSAQGVAALFGQGSRFFPMAQTRGDNWASENPSRVLELAASANRSLADGARGLSVSLFAQCAALILALQWLGLPPASPLLLLFPLVRAFGSASALAALFIVRPEDGEPAVRGLWRTWLTAALLALSSAVGACYWLAGPDASQLSFVCGATFGITLLAGQLHGAATRRLLPPLSQLPDVLRGLHQTASSSGFAVILLLALAVSLAGAAWLGAGVGSTNGPLFGLVLACVAVHACCPVGTAFLVHNHTLHAAGRQIASPLATPNRAKGRTTATVTLVPSAELQAIAQSLVALPPATTIAMVLVAFGHNGLGSSRHLVEPCVAGLVGVLLVLLHDTVVARHLHHSAQGLHGWYKERFSKLSRSENGGVVLPDEYRPAYAECLGQVERLALSKVSLTLALVPALVIAGYWAVYVLATPENSISLPGVATWFLAFASSVGISQSLLSTRAATPLPGIVTRTDSEQVRGLPIAGALAVNDAFNQARGSAVQLLIETLGALLLLLSALSQSTS